MKLLNLKYTLLIAVILITATSLSWAQKTIQVTITQVSTTIGDCDGFIGGDSDPTWWWTGPGDVDDQCHGVGGQNGPFTQGVNISLLDETYDCEIDAPSTIEVTFNGCEDDGAGCVLGLMTGICDGSAGSITSNIPIPFTNGIYNSNPPICVNSTGCAGTWCYEYTIEVTGAFTGPPNNDICNAIDLGQFFFNTSGTFGAGGGFENLCSDTEPGEQTGGILTFPPGTVGQTVWFTFTTDGNPAANIFVDINGFGVGSDQLTAVTQVFESSDGTCSGTMTQVPDANTVLGVDTDYSMAQLECLKPETQYFVQVDGLDDVLFCVTGICEGDFEIVISDDGNTIFGNDDLCSAEDLGVIPDNGSVTRPGWNNYCAGIEPTEPESNLFDPEQTMWFQFVPPASGSVDIDVFDAAGDDIDLEISVWQSSDTTCSGFMGEIESEDILFSNSITGTDVLRVRCLDPNLTYWIQVDGDPCLLNVCPWLQEGTFDLLVTDGQDWPAPNDSICQATYLGDPTAGPISLTNQNNFCSDNIQEPYPSAFGTNTTVWYEFVAPPSGAIDIWAENDPLGTGDEVNIQLAVFGTDDMTCTGVPIEMDSEHDDLLDPYGPLSYSEHMLVTCLNPGETYWIMVDGSETTLLLLQDIALEQGVFDIMIEEHPGPPPITNDDICDAIPLGLVPGGGSVTSGEMINYCATVEPGEMVPDQWSDLEQTVWFTFQAPPTGNATIDLVSDPLGNGDEIMLQVAVYESSDGTCTGTMTEVGSDFDIISIPLNDESISLYCLTPEQTYFVQVDGWIEPITGYLVEGFFDVTVSEDPAFTIVPTNNNICGYQDLGVVPAAGSTPLTNGANYCANAEPGEPNASTGSIYEWGTDETVWFAFTTDANPGDLTIEISNAGDPNCVNFPIICPPLIPSFNVYEVSNAPSCDFADLTLIAENENILPLIDISSEILCPKANQMYMVQVDGLDAVGDWGTFDIQIIDNGNPTPLAANDLICNSHDLGVVPAGGSTVTYSGHNDCASQEGGEPNVDGFLPTDLFNAYDETVWFTFTTSANPGLTTIDAVSTANIDINFTVYGTANPVTCDFSDLLEIDGVDDLLSDDASLDLPCLDPNTTYYIQLDGVDEVLLIGGDNGTFDLTVTDNGPATVWPANDNICDAENLGVIPIGGATGPTNYGNFCASEEAGEPNVSGSTVVSSCGYDETVWFVFTTPATPGVITIQLSNEVGIDADFILYDVDNYPSCNFSDLTEVNSVDNQLIIDCPPPNHTYYIQVDADDPILCDYGGYGTFDLNITDDGSMTGYPPNDSVCNAIDLGVLPGCGSTPLVSGFNDCASEEDNEPNVSGLSDITDGDYDESVWYCFTPGATPGTATIDVINTNNIWATINVYEAPTGSCDFNDLQFIRGDNLPNIITGENSLEIACLDPTSKYFIQIDGGDAFSMDQGSFDIQITDDCVPAGPQPYNNICDAHALGNPTGGSVSALSHDNNCADVELNEPGVGANDESVWYSFTAPNSGQAQIDVNSIEYIDANFSLYHSLDGTCNMDSLDQVGGNHDDFLSFSVSHTETCLIPGETYYVQIDGGDFFGDMGAYDIIVTDAVVPYTPMANDDCSGAIPLTVNSDPCSDPVGDWVPGNYGDPTVSVANSYVSSCGDNCGDQWYSFTMPGGGSALIQGNDDYALLGFNNSEQVIVAYSGTCGSLSPINCDDGGFNDDAQFYVYGTPGETIYLQVFDDGGDDVNEQFGICVSDRCGSTDCLTGQTMQMGVPYCFDTEAAGGEDISNGEPGYSECGDGTDPENSVYLNFTNAACGEFTLSIQAAIPGNCLPGGLASNGMSMALYQDDTPCDNNFQSLIDCQTIDVCQGTNWIFNKEYTGFPLGTQFTLLIDGGLGILGGDASGNISFSENCPLAIDLLSFSGQNQEEVNVLDWSTRIMEITDYFEVERSIDGENFFKIGEVDGSDFLGGASAGAPGTDNEGADYKFVDEAPVSGHNLYRLRMVDQAGDMTYSNVVDIFLKKDISSQIVNIYPNPTNRMINIDLFAAEQDDYRIRITDMLGQVVVEEEKMLTKGINLVSYDLEDLSRGIYVIEMINTVNSVSARGKFIKN